MAKKQHAGESAMRRFKKARWANLRDEWKGWLLIVGIGLASAYWMLSHEGVGQVAAAFAFGVAVTVLTFGWSVGFDAHSLRWAWGAWGERWTADELAKLDSSWRVFHDLPDGKGNWDHVVVGAPGVFVIDTKNLSEPAVVDGAGLRAGRLTGGGRASRGSAVRLKEMIEREAGLALWVQGVVAVWGTLVGGEEKRDNVLYVPAPSLVESLRKLPPRLTEAQRSKVCDVLDSGTSR
jgi:hypothetical protein